MHKSMTEVPGPHEKVQVITTINCDVLTANINLMNINYGNLHYQQIQLFNAKLCK